MTPLAMPGGVLIISILLAQTAFVFFLEFVDAVDLIGLYFNEILSGNGIIFEALKVQCIISCKVCLFRFLSLPWVFLR